MRKVQDGGTGSLLEAGEELSSEHGGEDTYGLPALGRADPGRLVRRQPAAGDDAVDMGVEAQLLIPSMEESEETDVGTEVLTCLRVSETALKRMA